MNRRMQLYAKDHFQFTYTVDLAANGEHRVRVGCVAAVGNKRIAGAFNTYRNDPANTDYGNATYHAEHNCLDMIPERLLSRATLYIARINLAGELVPSYPCWKCEGYIKLSKIDALVYVDKNRQVVKERLRE